MEIALERAKSGGAPQKGGPAKKGEPRSSSYSGTVQAFESVRVFAPITGILKNIKVDIGDRVKRDEVLAVLFTPEAETQVRLDEAILEQAHSRVAQAKAHVVGAQAVLDSAKLGVLQAEGNLKSAAASAKFRGAEFQRMRELLAKNAIEERVLDECKERQVAAAETENSAKIAVGAAKSQVAATMANLDQARADLTSAEAGVKVAQVSLQKSQQILSLATIVAPFDGVVTQRNAWAGEVIRSGSNVPLVTVQRVDKLRIVAMIPERDVTLVTVGDKVEIGIHAFPDKKWSANLSRMAGVLDTKTAAMRIEVDLANPDGQIRPGMSATVTVNHR
jgi:multidrug resistance efflux pump